MTVVYTVSEFTQPPFENSYTISCVPNPATEGSKILPEIPGPVKVPPAGLPVKVTGESPASYCGSSPENVTTGIIHTVVV